MGAADAAYWRWTCTACDPGHQRDSAENASNKTVRRSPRVPEGQREGETTTWERILQLPPASQKIKRFCVEAETSSSIQMFVDQILNDNITIFSYKYRRIYFCIIYVYSFSTFMHIHDYSA